MQSISMALPCSQVLLGKSCLQTKNIDEIGDAKQIRQSFI